MTKKNIKYGNIEIDEDEFDLKNTKVRITTFIDLKILKKLKVEAKKLDIGYQTLLNKKLSDSLFEEKNKAKLSLVNIIKRLEILEKKVS